MRARLAMAKKRPSSPTSVLRSCSPVIIVLLSVFLCLLAVLGVLCSQSKLQTSFFPSRRRCRGFFLEDQFEGPPKVAFLFLTRRDLPLDFLWDTFFKNGDVEKFSIYIHSKPGFVFDESTTRSAFFYGRQLNSSIQVVWGESSMIVAERLLLGQALCDPANQRFILLSDSCVPVYSFSYVYNHVMSSPSFVDSFIDVHGFRYDPSMSPTIPEERWRKGSQWITLVRRHAEIVVDDNTVFPVFKKFCKRWPSRDLSFRRKLVAEDFDSTYLMQTIPKHRNCIPDEHYVQTLLSIHGLEDELERRTLTYTSWNQSRTKGRKRSWHPLTFDYEDARFQNIREIKAINLTRHEGDQSAELCHTNTGAAPCFLFARKFTVRAAKRILRQGLIDLGP